MGRCRAMRVLFIHAVQIPVTGMQPVPVGIGLYDSGVIAGGGGGRGAPCVGQVNPGLGGWR